MQPGRRLRWAALVLTLLPSALATAHAEDAAGEVSGVIVTGRHPSAAAYQVRAARSATKTDTPLIDVPQSVSVITAQQVSDQGVAGIGEAVRYTPGVFVAQGEGNRETLVFRGNPTTGDFFVDGVRDDIQTYRDLYNMASLEVFRGPNAMIFGRGGIGGVANRVTKTAEWQEARSATLMIGDTGQRRISLDLSHPLNDGIALRINGVTEDSESYRKGVKLSRWGINPTASVRLGPDTLIQAGFEHFEDSRTADRGIPSRYQNASSPVVGPLRLDPGQFFGDSANSPTWTDTDALNLFVSHQFNEAVSLRSRLRFAAYDKAYQNIYANNVVDPAETLVALAAYRASTQRENLISQTDLVAKVRTGPIAHTLLAGLELGRQVTGNQRFEGRFAGNAATLTVPIVASDAPRQVSWLQTASSTDNHGLARVSAVYVQDQADLTDRVKIVAGVRFERFITEVDDRRIVGFPAGQQRRFKVTDDLTSPRLGLIIKPAPSTSIYAAVSRTYQPRGGDQLTGLSLTNQNLEPEEFRNQEVGLKWDMRPTFSLTAAIFQLDRSNVLALSNPANPLSPTIPVGRQRTTGLEIGAAGAISDALNLVAAYTYSDSRFLDAVSGTVAAGARPANLPRHSASLWARRQLTSSLAAALGWSHQGERFASTDNRVELPAYDRFDAAFYYKVSPDLSVQLNLENLTGARYFLFANSNNNLTPGAPFSARVSLTGRF